jgi:hypothetical protein
MPLVFRRRLVAPLWTIAFITVALTAPPPSTLFVIPPTNLFVIAGVGMAMFIFTMPGRGSMVAHVSLSRRDSVARRLRANRSRRHLAHAGE